MGRPRSSTRLHPGALRRHGRELQRNVLARPGVHAFVLVLDHLKAGFNVPKILRSAEAFGAREVHLVGIGPFDPAPAKGAMRKVPLRQHQDFAPCAAALGEAGYTLCALTADGAEPLPGAALDRLSAFIVGHEETGLSFDPGAFPGMRTLAIPCYGQTRSLNVTVAASLAMYEYVRQHGLRPGPGRPPAGDAPGGGAE